jgi:hypothetical protein
MGPHKAILSYELRPGGNRPGPAELWTRFDQAVEQLVVAQEGGSVKGTRKALEHLSLVMHELADAVEQLKTPFERWPEPTVGPPTVQPERKRDES